MVQLEMASGWQFASHTLLGTPPPSQWARLGGMFSLDLLSIHPESHTGGQLITNVIRQRVNTGALLSPEKYPINRFHCNANPRLRQSPCEGYAVCATRV
jgi:hypothetical protein